MKILYSIGHSNYEMAGFIALLQRHGATAIADVRSHPVSRRFPQFDKSPLQASLLGAGIQYVFLGKELGARPVDPACYVNGAASFARIRASAAFAAGLERLRRGATEFNVCLMCAERDPADCHRTWLVAQPLHAAGCEIRHILADGNIELHLNLLRRLAGVDSGNASLFDDEAEVLAATAQREGDRIAFRAIGEEGAE